LSHPPPTSLQFPKFGKPYFVWDKFDESKEIPLGLKVKNDKAQAHKGTIVECVALKGSFYGKTPELPEGILAESDIWMLEFEAGDVHFTYNYAIEAIHRCAADAEANPWY
jgi:hypothetical protein